MSNVSTVFLVIEKPGDCGDAVAKLTNEYSYRGLTAANRGMQGVIGVLAVVLGATIVADTGAVALALV